MSKGEVYMKFLMANWEMFYTDSNQQNEEETLVDQISIDKDNKVYVLYESADYMITDGTDEEGNEVYSYYVSREIFDIILHGLKSNGYKQAKFET